MKINDKEFEERVKVDMNLLAEGRRQGRLEERERIEKRRKEMSENNFEEEKETANKMMIIKNFAHKLLDKQVDIPADFVKILNKNLWDLVEKEKEEEMTLTALKEGIKKQKEDIIYNVEVSNWHEIPAGLDNLEKVAIAEGKRQGRLEEREHIEKGIMEFDDWDGIDNRHSDYVKKEILKIVNPE